MLLYVVGYKTNNHKPNKTKVRWVPLTGAYVAQHDWFFSLDCKLIYKFVRV